MKKIVTGTHSGCGAAGARLNYITHIGNIYKQRRTMLEFKNVYRYDNSCQRLLVVYYSLHNHPFLKIKKCSLYSSLAPNVDLFFLLK